MSDLLIDESEVSLVTLSLALESAMIEHISPNNKALYIREPGMYSFWVEIYNEPKYILLRTIKDFSREVDELTSLRICNDINLRLIVPSVAVKAVERKEGVKTFELSACYPIFYREGVMKSHFIRMCRNFSEGMVHIHEHFDPEQKIFTTLDQESEA